MEPLARAAWSEEGERLTRSSPMWPAWQSARRSTTSSSQSWRTREDRLGAARAQLGHDHARHLLTCDPGTSARCGRARGGSDPRSPAVAPPRHLSYARRVVGMGFSPREWRVAKRKVRAFLVKVARRQSTVFYKDVASFLNDTRVKPQSRAMREVYGDLHGRARREEAFVERRRREDGYSPSGQGLRSDGETSESARSIEPSDVLEDAARPRLEARVDVALATVS
jgi:hypothetical protein